jgi:hypothetical protein
MFDKKPYAPPLWGKLGVSIKDLFTKKYTFKNQVVVKKHNEKTGLTVEVQSQGELNGYIKATQKSKDYGTAEVNVNTSGKADGKVTLDRLGLAGLVVTITGNEKPSGKINVDYSQELFAASASADSGSGGKSRPMFEGTAVVGYEGLSVGGQVKFDSTDMKDFNAAAEYKHSEFTATVQSAENTEKITVSCYRAHSPDLQIGASVDVGKAGQRVLSFGHEYQVDADTIVKGKFNTKGVVAAYVEYKMPNPKLQVGVGVSCNVSQSTIVADQFGLSFNIGDF